MFKSEFIFRSENQEFTALCNPEHLQAAAATALTQANAKFMEVVDKATGHTVLVCIHRQEFIFLYPVTSTKNPKRK